MGLDLPDAGWRHVAPGDVIELGFYEQAEPQPTPIRWRVLERTASDVLVLSERILDCKRYHRVHEDTTWRDCDLRGWLHQEFLPAAFTGSEQQAIATTTCAGNGEGSPDTQDRVFLLSVEEVRSLTTPGTDGVDRRAIGTPHARTPRPDGCRLYVYDKGVEKDYLTVDGERQGCSWWWTRTQLQIQDGRSSRAAFVGARGDVKSYGRVELAWYGVRPALRLRLPA